GADPYQPIGSLEVMWGAQTINQILIRQKALQEGCIELELNVTESIDPTGLLETIVRTFVPSNISISSLVCEGIDRGLPLAADISTELDWLGLLRLGPCGQWTKEQHILMKPRARGYAAYGPYWTLPAGRYEARLKFLSNNTKP